MTSRPTIGDHIYLGYCLAISTLWWLALRVAPDRWYGWMLVRSLWALDRSLRAMAMVDRSKAARLAAETAEQFRRLGH